MATTLNIGASIALCLLMLGIHPKTVVAQRSNKTVLLFVRHAEPDTSATGNNLPLSPEGRQRAQALIKAAQQATGGMKINALFVTQFLRTQQTAQPLADALSLKPKIFLAEDTYNATARLRQYKRRAVLVVGLRNTISEIIQFLTGKEIAPIAAQEYDNIFVVTIETDENDEGEEEETVRLEVKKYGEPYIPQK